MEQQLPEHHGWSCVVRFYAAVHLMTAYLIDKPRVRFDPASAEHAERKRAMDRCPELRDAPKRYRQLKDISESVRYDAGFKYTDGHDKDVRAHLDKVVAIVAPLVQRS
jgi:hypothetical protein